MNLKNYICSMDLVDLVTKGYLWAIPDQTIFNGELITQASHTFLHDSITSTFRRQTHHSNDGFGYDFWL
jgi:hypothetical protein